MVHNGVGFNTVVGLHTARCCQESAVDGPTRWCKLLFRKDVRASVTLVGDFARHPTARATSPSRTSGSVAKTRLSADIVRSSRRQSVKEWV